MRLYTLGNQFIKESSDIPYKFTGIIEYDNGSKEWHLNGQWHREDGPAVIWKNGTKFWYINNKCHRLDGPAVEQGNGHKEYWFDGKQYTKEQHVLLADTMKLKGLF